MTKDERDDLGHFPDGRYAYRIGSDGWSRFKYMTGLEPKRNERTRHAWGTLQGWNAKTGRLIASRPAVERRKDRRYYPWNAFDRLAIDMFELDGSAGFDPSRSVIKQEELW
jgi:hypothetical protein